MAVKYYQDWASLDMSSAPGDRPVAFCGDLGPASVLRAYQRGLIPFPAHDEYSRSINEFRYEDQIAEGEIAIVGDSKDDPYRVAWWSPDPRLTVPVENVHLGRNARKQLRRSREWTTTADHSFRLVAQECRADREPRWLTDELLDSLTDLHRTGWAHSIEVWEGDDLVGGAFGIGVGAVLSGDSMFNRRQSAARVAVADMAARAAQAGAALIDAQWDSPFLRSLGAEPMPRQRYLSVLAGSSQRLVLSRQALPARRLLPVRSPAQARLAGRGRTASAMGARLGHDLPRLGQQPPDPASSRPVLTTKDSGPWQNLRREARIEKGSWPVRSEEETLVTRGGCHASGHRESCADPWYARAVAERITRALTWHARRPVTAGAAPAAAEPFVAEQLIAGLLVAAYGWSQT
jgi:leucyl/phenylalanyl-tRNA--protein transferase